MHIRFFLSITLISFLSTTMSVYCQFDIGLVGFWSFDGCKTIDSSTNKFHGTPVDINMPCITGVQKEALEFDGIKDFIDIGDRSLFKNGEDITITAWINMNPNSGDGGFSSIITKWENNNGPQEWWFGLYKNELHFTTQGYPCGTLCPERTSQGLNIDNNCWTFVGIILTGNNRIQYIKDGIIVDEDKSTYTFSPQSTSVRIGRQNPNSRPRSHFMGGIDEVRVYNRALSLIEIKNLYDKDFKDPTIYKFSEVRICKGDSITINGGVPYSAQYSWSPIYNISCSNCTMPIVFPDTAITYTCKATGSSACENTISQIKVVIDTTSTQPLNIKLSRDIKVAPDKRFEMSITTDDNLSLFGIKEFSARITSNFRLMSVDSTIGIPTIKRGNALDNTWTLTSRSFIKDTLNTIHISGKGITPIGAGDSLFSVAFRSYLPDVISYEPSMKVDFRSAVGCFPATVSSGLVTLESCFIEARLVKSSQFGYALTVNSNPQYSELLSISFSIGLSGKTTIDIFDYEGKLCRRLLDECHESGEYKINLIDILQSGMYFCKMSSGQYENTVGFVVSR